MRSRSLRIAASAVALGLGSLSLVACSDDKSSDTSSAAASAAPATEAGAAAETAAAGEATTAAPATEAPVVTKAGPSKEGGDIIYTAVAAGGFLTLAKLVAAAGLLDTLHGEGPFTVFAPTDAAFAAVPKATLDAVAADKAKLTKVLTYHVVAGKVLAADLANGDLATVEGSPLKIAKSGCQAPAVTETTAAGAAPAPAAADTVAVNEATVIAADVIATNGVIHVIDKVLIPPDI